MSQSHWARRRGADQPLRQGMRCATPSGPLSAGRSTRHRLSLAGQCATAPTSHLARARGALPLDSPLSSRPWRAPLPQSHWARRRGADQPVRQGASLATPSTSHLARARGALPSTHLSPVSRCACLCPSHAGRDAAAPINHCARAQGALPPADPSLSVAARVTASVLLGDAPRC
jgi:hypothetical protein